MIQGHGVLKERVRAAEGQVACYQQLCPVQCLQLFGADRNNGAERKGLWRDNASQIRNILKNALGLARRRRGQQAAGPASAALTVRLQPRLKELPDTWVPGAGHGGEACGRAAGCAGMESC